MLICLVLALVMYIPIVETKNEINGFPNIKRSYEKSYFFELRSNY
ncbi:hypothetical protein THOG11_20327 [Vibrio harveyi]|jgi:hypothetical protein|nr:hypothetical protein TH15OA1_530072 [Vibrio harveyi]CAH1541281.1 hypothetical protein VHARVF571_510024 [Vibrio harveyi]CAH1556776.1 hypothetical protein THOD03_20322 [Vibrio harveyi]CAH1563849.1 hypothetical protein THOG11_20327 [Vibrio harveyi]